MKWEDDYIRIYTDEDKIEAKVILLLDTKEYGGEEELFSYTFWADKKPYII